jgi:hypothetical protein
MPAWLGCLFSLCRTLFVRCRCGNFGMRRSSPDKLGVKRSAVVPDPRSELGQGAGGKRIIAPSPGQGR